MWINEKIVSREYIEYVDNMHAKVVSLFVFSKECIFLETVGLPLNSVFVSIYDQSI